MVHCGRPRASLDPKKSNQLAQPAVSRLTSGPTRKLRSQLLHSKQSPQNSLSTPSSSKISDSLVSALRERLAEEAERDQQVLPPEQVLTPSRQSGHSGPRPGHSQQQDRIPWIRKQQQQQRHLHVDLDNLSQDPLQGIDCQTTDAFELLTRCSDLAKIGFLDSALKVVQAAVEADRKDVLGR